MGATAEDCPAKKIPTLPKKLSVVKTTCGPDETECPAGCCPEANWFCCPDNRYCAATADDCPAIRLPNLLPKKLSVVKTTCGPDETECQLDVAQKPTGSVVPTTDIVQPLLMTAQPKKSPPYPKNCLLSRPPVAQMKLNAQLDVAQKPTGSAVPTTDIVPPLLMTAQPSNCPVYSQKRL